MVIAIILLILSGTLFRHIDDNKEITMLNIHPYQNGGAIHYAYTAKNAESLEQWCIDMSIDYIPEVNKVISQRS